MLVQGAFVGASMGFAGVLILASLLNKLGDVLYTKGLVSPFFVRGRRIHHRDVLFLLLPGTYSFVVSLILVGYVNVDWSGFWSGIETTFVIAACCLLLDFALDRVSFGLRERALLHHEWAYLLVPAYMFTHVLTVLV